jgi:GNAT superfamily N-acetyltransferase
MTAESITIRRADTADLDTLHILAGAMGSTKEPGYFGTCLTEQAEGRRELFILASNGADAGYGMLNWYPQYSLYRRLEIPEIQDINVLPAFRRRGLATALIRHCEEQARVRGCAQMGIAVGLYADYGAAQRLYVRLGYMPDGFGITYDRETVRAGDFRPVDDNLCLMMVRDIA